MAAPLLTVDNLKVSFKDQTKVVLAVSGISFTIAAGETLALVGESGCGKSLTALAMLQLLPVNAYYHKTSHIWFHGEDLLSYSPHQMRTIRGGKIAIIFQEPMTSLNPVLTIEQQIAEVLIKHKGLHGHHLKNHVINLLEQVGIDNAALRCRQYPHQLSGGQKQRVMIAMAIATEPDLLIADEPTTALDVTIQAQILALLKSLQQQLNMAMLLITHDLGVVKQVADKVAVMYAGHFVETAATSDFFQQPLHPYSRKLFESLPNMAKRLQPLQSIKGIVPELKQHWDSCRFAARCPWYLATCSDSEPSLLVNLPHHEVRCFRVNDILLQPTQLPPVTIPPPLDSDTTTTSPVLQVTNLKIHFTGAARLIKAVDGISFALYPGETLAVVGESGCGKTTTGRGLLQLIPVTAGEIQFKNYNLLTLQGKKLQQLRKQMQIIFQDPFSAMNPRMLVSDTIMEGMRAYGLYPNAQQRRTRVVELLEQVGLPLTSYNRYPHQFSGGQRQRICIARALAVEPEIIICDEPTSALDVSVQAQIINLLKKLQQQLGLSYIFISHNLAVVSYIADRIVVMYQGKIVETGATTTLLNHPQHPYTKQLLAAVPTL